MSLKSFLLVLVIAATAYSQPAQNFNLTEFRRCNRLSVERICTNNPAYVSDRLETLVNCGQEEPARITSIAVCARDEQAGLYCGASEAYQSDLGVASVSCASALQPGGQCSAQRRDNLTSLRDDLGCCVNAYFNKSAARFGPAFVAVLSYSLWSSCGVELPNSTCDGELPFTLPATPLRTCTTDELVCREADINEIRNSIAGEPSCEVVLQYNLDACSRKDASDDGQCLLGLQTDLVNSIPSIASDCEQARLMQSCPSACRESLREFADSRGCCVNTLYNSTFGQVNSLNMLYFQDSMLFDLCDVDTPPLTCTDESNCNSLALKSFTLMMLLPLIIALLGPNNNY